jgi:hypothetical protein
MHAVHSSKMLMNLYQTTWHHIEDRTLFIGLFNDEIPTVHGDIWCGEEWVSLEGEAIYFIKSEG